MSLRAMPPPPHAWEAALSVTGRLRTLCQLPRTRGSQNVTFRLDLPRLRDCEAEARPADETAEAEQGQRSVFCKPAATGAAKTGHRNRGPQGRRGPGTPETKGTTGTLGTIGTILTAGTKRTKGTFLTVGTVETIGTKETMETIGTVGTNGVSFPSFPIAKTFQTFLPFQTFRGQGPRPDGWVLTNRTKPAIFNLSQMR